MLTVQEIFNLAIERGEYKAGGYMCHSVGHMCRYGVITRAEQDRAHSCINKYMASLSESSRDIALFTVIYPDLPGDLYVRTPVLDDVIMRIYQNWAKRPKTKTAVLKMYMQVLAEWEAGFFMCPSLEGMRRA